MNIINNPVTGREERPDALSPYAALVDFYHAFNHQDAELMQSNWLQSEEASMSNPLGGLKRGWREISEVYKNIFNGHANVYVEFYDYSIHRLENMFIAVGHERGSLEIHNERVELAIRTTRAYCLHDNQWKQIHHHGSMDNPQLLALYQSTLKRD